MKESFDDMLKRQVEMHENEAIPPGFDEMATWERLDEMLHPERRRGIIWWWFGAAASLLILFGIGFQLWWNSPEQEAIEVAEEMKPVDTIRPTTNVPVDQQGGASKAIAGQDNTHDDNGYEAQEGKQPVSPEKTEGPLPTKATSKEQAPEMPLAIEPAQQKSNISIDSTGRVPETIAENPDVVIDSAGSMMTPNQDLAAQPEQQGRDSIPSEPVVPEVAAPDPPIIAYEPKPKRKRWKLRIGPKQEHATDVALSNVLPTSLAIRTKL